MSALIKLNQNGVSALTAQELQEAKKQLLENLSNATKISRKSYERQLPIIEEELNKRDLGTSSESKEVEVEVTEIALLKELLETNQKISSWVSFFGILVILQIIAGVIYGFTLMP